MYDRKTTQATIELLAERFPQCFSVWQGRRKPLKIGIREDLVAALAGAITAKELSAALRLYCTNTGYLKASAEGASRIDLNGKAAGQVTTDEADNAKQRLAQQNAKLARRQEAQAKNTAKAEVKVRNAGRVSLADLRKAAEKRRGRAA